MKRFEFNSKKHKGFLERSNPLSLPMPGFSFSLQNNQTLSEPERRAAFDLSCHLLKARLGDDLAALFGKRDEMVLGKYRKASAFYFDAGNADIVVAVCEKGDRGSSWYWIPGDLEEANMLHGPGNVIMQMERAPSFWAPMLLELASGLHTIHPELNPDLISASLPATATDAPKRRNPSI